MKTKSYQVGDKVVYPAHGVGEIKAVQSKNIGGKEHKFFDILIMDSGMKIMVPVDQSDSVGLRPVVDKKTVDKIYKILQDRKVRIDTQTWNRRYREYTQKIKTGSVYEMAEVLRDLSVLSSGKELSFGEKKMFDTVRELLVSEIAIAKARTHDRVRGELQTLMGMQ